MTLGYVFYVYGTVAIVALLPTLLVAMWALDRRNAGGARHELVPARKTDKTVDWSAKRPSVSTR